MCITLCRHTIRPHSSWCCGAVTHAPPLTPSSPHGAQIGNRLELDGKLKIRPMCAIYLDLHTTQYHMQMRWRRRMGGGVWGRERKALCMQMRIDCVHRSDYVRCGNASAVNQTQQLSLYPVPEYRSKLKRKSKNIPPLTSILTSCDVRSKQLIDSSALAGSRMRAHASLMIGSAYYKRVTLKKTDQHSAGT